MQKLKTGDSVIVTTGKDKGRSGKILKIVTKKKKASSGQWVVVEDINVVQKHVRGNPQQNIPGGIKPKEMPLHVSNVALLNSSTGKGEKVGIKFLEDGKKVRFFKSTGEVIDV